MDDLDTYIVSRIKRLEDSKETLINYLKLKLEEEDWHGVEDAASDIRDIEAAIASFDDVLTKL